VGADSPTIFKQRQIMNALESVKVALAEAQLLGLDPAIAGNISGDKTIGASILFNYPAPELFHQGEWTKQVFTFITYYSHPTYATKFVFSN
jgi:hypothetical protein